MRGDIEISSSFYVLQVSLSSGSMNDGVDFLGSVDIKGSVVYGGGGGRDVGVVSMVLTLGGGYVRGFVGLVRLTSSVLLQGYCPQWGVFASRVPLL